MKTHRIAASFLLFWTLAGASTAVHATDSSEASRLTALGQVLTFEELMALPSASREIYIRGLQDIVVDYAAFRGDAKDEAYVEEIRDDGNRNKWALFLSELEAPAAWAQADEDIGTLAVPEQGDHYAQTNPMHDTGDATGKRFHLECENPEDVELIVIPLYYDKPYEHLGIDNPGVCSRVGSKNQENCPEGFIKLKVQENTYCASNNSYNQVATDPHLATEQKAKLKSLVVKNQAATKAPESSAEEARAVSSPPKSGSETHVAKAQAASPPSPLAACEPHFTCDQNTPKGRAILRNKTISPATRFFPGSPSCIYAGNASTFDASMNKHCRPVSSFENPSLKCAKPRSILCNPMIFGTDPHQPSSPLCIAPAQHATRECMLESGGPDSSRSANLFLEQHPGLAKTWNLFASEISKMCPSNASTRLYHCEECSIILKKIVALHAEVQGLHDCNKAQEWIARRDKSGNFERAVNTPQDHAK